MKRFAFLALIFLIACSGDTETNIEPVQNSGEVPSYLAKIYAEYSAGVGTTKESAAGFLWKREGKYYIVSVGHLLCDKANPYDWQVKAALKNSPKVLLKLKLINQSEDPDAALFSVEEPGFKFDEQAAVFGDSANLSETLVALGHPDGKINQAAEAKLVASDYRTRNMKTPMICHISILGEYHRHVGQGSSGGPLLNEAGEVVGIHVGMMEGLKIEGKTATFAFATPINTAKKLFDEWLKSR